MGLFSRTTKYNKGKMEIKILNERDTIKTENDEVYICMDEKDNKFKISDIHKISIFTTDQGPFVDDVALSIVLNQCSFLIPSEHYLYQKFLFDDISKKVSLDFQKIIEASSSTQNAEFVLYLR